MAWDLYHSYETYILLIIGFIGAFCFWYFCYWFGKKKRIASQLLHKRSNLIQLDKLAKEKEAKEKERLSAFFRSKFDSIKKAVNQFDNLLDLNRGYFSNYQLTVWKDNNSKVFEDIQDKPLKNTYLAKEEVSTIRSFLTLYNNADTLRKDFNKKFVEEELRNYSHFFDDIGGVELNYQQRTAIIKDEDNNIVIAGAGSGKTKTIVGKVEYIVDRYKINPKEILLISFTRKTAESVAKSIGIKDIEVKTFHKFGMDVITEVEGTKPSTFDEEQFGQLLKKQFKECIKSEIYLKKVIDYFSDFIFEKQGDYIDDHNTSQEVSINPKTTYNGEKVKSIEECKIANFLLFNSIDYRYEDPYEFDTATEKYSQYKPDFTIYQNGRRVYIEHFGVARDGSVPNFFAEYAETLEEAKKLYWEKINWARKIHKNCGTSLVETFSYEMREGTLFHNLSERLVNEGIKLDPKSPEEIWDIIHRAAYDDVDYLTNLFKTFIILMKQNNYTIDEVIEKNNQTQGGYQNKKNAIFIEIVKPIYEGYEECLAERNEIDFSDMISRASKYIASGELNRKFSYVLIDEFQDISIGRYNLVKAIKTSNPDCKLFCVGDDWQSIYRFAGSDMALLKNFEKYFGYTEKSNIETTYRFHNPLMDISSKFILMNPTQEDKKLKESESAQTESAQTTEWKIIYSNSNQDDTSALKKVFDKLIAAKKDIESKTIYILSRYNFDIDRIKNNDRIFNIDKDAKKITYMKKTKSGETKKITAMFLTIHQAKGLEADIVIIINCNSGKYGFPSERSDDLVLNLLLSEADQFEHGEERRLFYVAATRAKENVYFIAYRKSKSKFIVELEEYKLQHQQLRSS